MKKQKKHMSKGFKDFLAFIVFIIVGWTVFLLHCYWDEIPHAVRVVIVIAGIAIFLVAVYIAGSIPDPDDTYCMENYGHPDTHPEKKKKDSSGENHNGKMTEKK